MDNKLVCDVCNKKFKNSNIYLKHIEMEIKKSSCKCNKKGGVSKKKLLLKKIPLLTKSKPKSKKNMDKVFSRAKNILDKTLEKLEENSALYGLKNSINKKSFEKLPIEIQEKISKIVMENEYLKGLLKSQEKQIRLMKKQIDKCITKSTIQYVVDKKQ